MRTLLFALIVISVGALGQQSAPARPKITGVDHVAFYTTNPEANRRLLQNVLGLASAPPLEEGRIMES